MLVSSIILILSSALLCFISYYDTWLEGLLYTLKANTTYFIIYYFYLKLISHYTGNYYNFVNTQNTIAFFLELLHCIVNKCVLKL